MDSQSEQDNSLEPIISASQASQTSQTAAEFISSQLQLEADAREVLPYQFDTCTHSLGPLRQSVFACLTCNPPSANPYSPAGVCYSCSISCHGDHELVELFTHRNFVCDCGTTRVPSSSPCSLRINGETGSKGGVHSEQPSATNGYNHNFQNRFCGCGELYDPHTEPGTMYQCYGLGSVEDGGCGEDWWHPECLLGMSRDWYKDQLKQSQSDPERDHDEHPDPPGFPKEDSFEHFICYKCVSAFPWIKQYAGTPGFLAPVPYNKGTTAIAGNTAEPATEAWTVTPNTDEIASESSRKRKADEIASEQDQDPEEPLSLKRAKSEDTSETKKEDEASLEPAHSKLPPAPSGPISLFLKEDFRDHLCRCPACFPLLIPHPHLLEEETIYEPPMSTASSVANGVSAREGSVGSRSLLERGEAALSNMDRVKAIEGVMVYNHLRDKVKDFLKPFAESGTAVGADDVKKYFEKLRGDEEAIRLARLSQSSANNGDGGEDDDKRQEQGGY